MFISWKLSNDQSIYDKTYLQINNDEGINLQHI